MAFAIKQVSSNTANGVGGTTALYTVPTGIVAKVIISNLFTENSAGDSTKLVVGNLDLGVGVSFSSERSPIYIGAGQTVTVVRTVAGGAPRCTVQFAVIEETAS